ncbi:MAG: hypothetical protein R3C26_00775 [Calditrichia bacterium]
MAVFYAIIRCRTAASRSFFPGASDAVINRAFGMTQSCWLFGRLNRLLLPDGQPLVEVVEILPETSPK